MEKEGDGKDGAERGARDGDNHAEAWRSRRESTCWETSKRRSTMKIRKRIRIKSRSKSRMGVGGLAVRPKVRILWGRWGRRR
jgi:hypothetical protein